MLRGIVVNLIKGLKRYRRSPSQGTAGKRVSKMRSLYERRYGMATCLSSYFMGYAARFIQQTNLDDAPAGKRIREVRSLAAVKVSL